MNALQATCARGLIVAVALALGGCRPSDTDAYQGYIEGEYVYVASPLGGELLDLAVRRGDSATNGQPLFTLEREQEAAALQAAEARLAQAQAELADREKGERPSEIAALEAEARRLQSELALAASEVSRRRRAVESSPGAVSEEELDRIQTRLAAGEAQLARIHADLETAKLGAREDQVQAAARVVEARAGELRDARWRLDQKEQRASIQATVHDTLFREGEWVGPGLPVVVLLPPQNLKVRFFVPQTELHRIAIGKTVRVRWDGAERDYPATIRYISTRSEYTPPVIYSRETRAKLVFLVEAFFAVADAAGLKAGQPVDVTLAATGR